MFANNLTTLEASGLDVRVAYLKGQAHRAIYDATEAEAAGYRYENEMYELEAETLTRDALAIAREFDLS